MLTVKRRFRRIVNDFRTGGKQIIFPMSRFSSRKAAFELLMSCSSNVNSGAAAGLD
jgi:hypothetical protein